MIKVSMTDYGYKTKSDCNGMQVTIDLSKPEAHKEIEIPEFLELVGNQGYSFSGGIFNGGRKIENWKEQEIFALDFDNKEGQPQITPEQVLNRCEDFKISPFGIYRTLGSKTPTDKFRVFFKHYKLITNPKIANYILNLFYLLFPESDKNCIEISRLFFGGQELTYTNEEAEFHIVQLNGSVAKHAVDTNQQVNFKQHIQNSCENAKMQPVGKEMFEDFKDDRDEFLTRVFEYDDIEYYISFIPIVLSTAGVEEETKKQKGKKVFGMRSQKKLTDALRHLSKNTYAVVLEVAWGLNNTYGEPAYNFAWEWCKDSEHINNNLGEFKKKWDDGTQRGEITVGTIYHKAKEAGWKYVDEDLKWFDDRFFVSKLGGKTLIFRTIMNPVTQRRELDRQDIRNFKQLYSWKKTTVETGGIEKVVPAVDVWLDDTDSRRYDGGVWFDPSNQLPKNCYNMWLGYKFMDPAYKIPDEKNTMVGRYLDHLYRNISSSDDRIYEYVLNWMAKAVKEPHIKAPVVLVLRSDQEGVGKGAFANFFGELFGESFTIVSKPEDVVGNFNGHLQNCILLHSDEAEYGKRHHSILKNLITENYININPKGIAAFQAKSYLHIIMSSNSDFVVPAGIGSRRFCMLDVKQENKRDTVFFEAMRKDLEKGGYKELFHRLLARDLSNFNIYDYPETDTLNKQILFTLDKEFKFIYEKLMEGILDTEKGDWLSITSDIFAEDYGSWVLAKYGHGKYKLSPTEIGILLKKLFGDNPYWKKERIRKDVRVHGHAMPVSKLVQKYTLPPLEMSRKCFERFVNFEIEWEYIEESEQPEIMESPERKIISMFDFSKSESM